jgi:transcriptional antiterminator NusG
MKRWYVIQVYAGYEQQVKADLEKRIRESVVNEYFGEVLVPSSKLKQMFEAVDTKSQQLFPGYVLVEMEMKPETARVVTSSMRVLKFLGGEDPMPLATNEIDRILSQIKGEIKIRAEESGFVVGGEVEIQDGPFAGFVGIVDKVDKENEKLTVMVSIFGRMTPVELHFNQVKR